MSRGADAPVIVAGLWCFLKVSIKEVGLSSVTLVRSYCGCNKHKSRGNLEICSNSHPTASPRQRPKEATLPASEWGSLMVGTNDNGDSSLLNGRCWPNETLKSAGTWKRSVTKIDRSSDGISSAVASFRTKSATDTLASVYSLSKLP